MSSALGTYAAHHLRAFLASLGRLARAPFGTFLTFLVIAVALSLPLGLELLVSNVRAATGGFGNAVDLSVYLKTDVAVAKAEQLAKSARAHAGVARVDLISADAALAQFRKYSGFGAALGVLNNNPLPNVLHVHPSEEAKSPAALDALRGYFTAWPEVDLVQIDAQWVQRFNAILDVSWQLLLISAAVLAAGVIAVIGNTVRLEIDSQRAEIEVVKIVGGTHRFVRRPFLYEGVLYGLGGALLAWGIAAVALALLDVPVANLAKSYGSHFVLLGPAPRDLEVLLGAGIVCGWVGAWVSATRHLQRIEPRA